MSRDRPAPSETTAAWHRWVPLAVVGLGALAAVLYLWNLTISGYANTYYSAAALAASQSWSAWFFGSFDAANFITVDKPPLSTMVMGLSVRLLGLSSWSILLPQALAGVASVLVVFGLARRSFGPAAGLIAGLVMALTPVAVLMFRYNNPDALLTLLLLLAAWALLRAIDGGRLGWVVLSALLVGLAFNTKYLQAWLVLPVFALVYLVAAPGGIGRRFGGLLAAAATVVVSSFAWVVLVDLIPASARPYIGGSTNNSALDLVFGYDGLGRIFGMAGPGGGSAGPGGASGFGGESGLLRVFNDQFGTQISWLIPLAVIGLVVGLWVHRRAGRRDARLAAYLLWGGWLVTHVLVFSLMSGIIHPYYTVALAPAVAVLVGAGMVEMWRLRERSRWGGLILAGSVVATAVWAVALLDRTPDFAPGLGVAALAGAIVAGVLLALPRGTVPMRLAAVAAMAGLIAVLLGPASFAVATVDSPISGGDPSAGPVAISGRAGLGAVGTLGDGGSIPDWLSGAEAFPDQLPGLSDQPGAADGSTPGSGAAGDGPDQGAAPGGAVGAGPGSRGPETVDQTLVDFLVANRGDATWVVAATSAMSAGSIQLATGLPVMAMGGFSGNDPAPTLDELKASIEAGELRFVIVGRGGAGAPGQGGLPGTFPGGIPGLPPGGFPGQLPGGLPGGSSGAGPSDGLAPGTGSAPGGGAARESNVSDRDAWVTSACEVVTLDTSSSSDAGWFGSAAGSLYDCADAAGSN